VKKPHIRLHYHEFYQLWFADISFDLPCGARVVSYTTGRRAYLPDLLAACRSLINTGIEYAAAP
jgi:hypothetical protein